MEKLMFRRWLPASCCRRDANYQGHCSLSVVHSNTSGYHCLTVRPSVVLHERYLRRSPEQMQVLSKLSSKLTIFCWLRDRLLAALRALLVRLSRTSVPKTKRRTTTGTDMEHAASAIFQFEGQRSRSQDFEDGKTLTRIWRSPCAVSAVTYSLSKPETTETSSDYSLAWTPSKISLVDLAVVCIT